MHTTPSHVALDTTGTLNGRTLHLATRTFQVLAASIGLTYYASSKSLNRIPFTFPLLGIQDPIHFRY